MDRGESNSSTAVRRRPPPFANSEFFYLSRLVAFVTDRPWSPALLSQLLSA